MLEMQDAFGVVGHRGSQSVHGEFVQPYIVVNVQSIVLDGNECIETHRGHVTVVKRHDGMTKPKQEPPLSSSFTRRCSDFDSTRLFVDRQVPNQNPQDINASSAFLQQITVLKLNHASAPYTPSSPNPLLKSAASGFRSSLVWDALRRCRPRHLCLERRISMLIS